MSQMRADLAAWVKEYEAHQHEFDNLDERKTMPDIGQMIESKYLKGADIPDPVIVTIRGVKQVNIAKEDAEPEYKWAIKFAEFDKPMILNVTNMKIAAKVLGSTNTDDWAGKEIVLYFDENVTFGGELVGGLRFKRKEPEPKKAATKGLVGMKDDVPF